jgi:hypothetical protein
MTAPRTIYCSGTAATNPPNAKIHPPHGPAPVLGTVVGGTPTATWGYLCDDCAATWHGRRHTLAPTVHPRNTLPPMVPRPRDIKKG